LFNRQYVKSAKESGKAVFHPVAAGSGFSLFEKLSKPLYLKLIETKVFNTGATVHVYQPENLLNK
jgi:hypothetical protein